MLRRNKSSKKTSTKVIRTKKSTKVSKGEDRPLWVKITGGFLRLPGRTHKVKPNEKIYATREELGSSISQFKLVREGNDSSTTNSKEKPKEVEEMDFELKHSGGGWYDVVSKESGKKMNESKLRSSDAKELIDSLNKKGESQ